MIAMVARAVCVAALAAIAVLGVLVFRATGVHVVQDSAWRRRMKLYVSSTAVALALFVIAAATFLITKI